MIASQRQSQAYPSSYHISPTASSGIPHGSTLTPQIQTPLHGQQRQQIPNIQPTQDSRGLQQSIKDYGAVINIDMLNEKPGKHTIIHGKNSIVSGLNACLSSNVQRSNVQPSQAYLLAHAQSQAFAQSNAIKVNNSAIFRLHHFLDSLCGLHYKHGIEYWRNMVREFFNENSSIRWILWNNSLNENKAFEISTTIAPRFFHSFFRNGIRQIQLVVENIQESIHNSTTHIIESLCTSCIFWFADGTQNTQRGRLKLSFNALFSMQIDLFEIQITEHAEYIPRSFHPSNSSLPNRLLNDFGIPSGTMRYLEVAESMSHMRDLITFSLASNVDASPTSLFSTFVNTIQPHLSPSFTVTEQPNPSIASLTKHDGSVQKRNQLMVIKEEANATEIEKKWKNKRKIN